MKRAFRTIGRALLVVTGSVAIVLVVGVLRLLAGPIELEFLHDRAQREFATAGGKVRVTSGRVMLEWPAISQPVRLVAHDIKVVDEAGVVLASAPSVALSVEAHSLLAGKFAPTIIIIEKPVLDADIRKGGILRAMLNTQDTQPQARVAALVIDQLLGKPNNDRLLGQLDTVQVEGARLTLRDSSSGLQWTAPAAKARLKRDASGVVITAEARFASTGSEPISVMMSGNYSRDRSHVTLESRVEGVRLSEIASAMPDAAILRGLDVPLAGILRVEANGLGEIESITAELVGINGRVSLPGVMPVAHPMTSLQAKVVVDMQAQTVKSVRVIGDFGAAHFDVNGAGVIKDGELTFAGKADITRLPVDRLGDYWPVGFAPGGRDWAVANISSGKLDVAAEFAFRGKLGALELLVMERVVGTLDYRDLTVRYIPEMPPLEGVSGTARYEGGSLRFDIATGHASGLTVTGATVEMTALNEPGPQIATIKVPITGKAGAMMEYLARPRLALPKDLLYAPSRVAGDVATEVWMRFPMINSLALFDIELKAEASLSAFTLREAIGKVDLTDGTARLSYDGHEMQAAGHAKLDGNPVDIEWRELFAARAQFRRRYVVKGTLPSAVLPKAGLFDVEPAISGPIGLNVTYQVATNGTSEVQGRFDLKAAKVSVPPVGWSKPAGIDGQATGTVRLGANGKLTTLDFDGKGGGLAAKGQARFAGDNEPQQLTLQSITLGRTDLSADWRRAANGMELALRGHAIEWKLVRDFLHQRELEADKKAKTAGAAPPPPATRVAVSVALDQVLVEKGTLGGLHGSFEVVGERMNFADLTMPAGGGATYRITPTGQGRTIKINVTNLGQLLKSAGWLDGLVDGWLTFDGRFDDSQPVAPVTGKLSMGQFRMEKVTPRPGIGSLNGTIDGLTRAGDPLQVYEILEGDIVKTGETINLKRGRTNGRSIGLTSQGTIDLATDTVKLRGIVVPSFAINNALSNVPLLGPLLTGGRDGGVFSIAYRLEGPLDDPKVNINRMSAIAPGALREVFTGESDVDFDKVNPDVLRAP